MVYDMSAALKERDILGGAVNAYAAGQKLRQQRNQNALMEARKGYGRNSLAAGGEFSPESYLQAYAADAARAGDFEALTSGQKAYGDFQKQQADIGKTQRETRNLDFTGLQKQLELQGQLLGSARDQASWDNALRIASANGIDVSDVPPQYSPQVVSDLQQMTLSSQQRLEQMWKQRGHDMDVARFSYQQQNDAQNRAVTLRGQNMTDARVRAAAAARPSALTSRPPTEFQSKSGIYGARAESADKTINALHGKYDPGVLSAKSAVAKLPLVGGVAEYAANKFLTKEAQMVEQAKRDFINAVLRQESGAAIAQHEFENADRQYFPQPGDSEEVIAQKARNRSTAIQGLKQNAGPAAYSASDNEEGALPPQRAGTNRQSPQVGQRLDGMPMPHSLPVGTEVVDDSTGTVWRNTGKTWRRVGQ